VSPEEERIRGADAKQVLDNRIYKEAFSALEARWINELAQQEIEPKRAEYVRTLLVAGRRHKQYLEQVMVSGTMAAMEIERKRTLAERMLRRS
jgi:hypothetical protein